jgi:hypothetical protein
MQLQSMPREALAGGLEATDLAWRERWSRGSEKQHAGKSAPTGSPKFTAPYPSPEKLSMANVA